MCVVMHVGLIYQIKSYRQESRQAGQDRKQSEAIILVRPRQQEALKQYYKQIQRQGVVLQVAITKEDKKQAEQDKVSRFISSAQC